ncbi:MAG TPA: hypothetical protein PKC21_08620 [Oligoflexia bacterium]|nr:hypothetical protein [Oligoflexia bacterium]HMR25403.1 hypothetical protein [Oligoflexia bacterium]
MTDPKNKTANQDHQVERTLSNDKQDHASNATSSEHEITKDKTIIKNPMNSEPKNQKPSSPSKSPAEQPNTHNSGNYNNPMPGLDGPTRLQNIDDYADLKKHNPFNQALEKGKNFSAEFAQGFASIPKKIITAYQGYAGEENKNSMFKQFGLVILACVIFYFWTVLRFKNIAPQPKTSASKELMVDIIELYTKGERKKARILIKKAAELEADEELAQKLNKLAK